MNYSSETCDELLQILKYLDPEWKKKIPKDVMNYLYQNCNSESSFVYNQAKELSKQNLSRETKEVLGKFLEKYWTTS